jgi:hypothetical protein
MDHSDIDELEREIQELRELLNPQEYKYERKINNVKLTCYTGISFGILLLGAPFLKLDYRLVLCLFMLSIGMVSGAFIMLFSYMLLEHCINADKDFINQLKSIPQPKWFFTKKWFYVLKKFEQNQKMISHMYLEALGMHVLILTHIVVIIKLIFAVQGILSK